MSPQVDNRRQSLSFLERLKDALQIGLGVFLFCAVSLLAVAAIVSLIGILRDPHHAVLAAALQAARFCRIPFAVTTGLAIFFAAVGWESADRRAGKFEKSVEHRLTVIEKRLGIEAGREVS